MSDVTPIRPPVDTEADDPYLTIGIAVDEVQAIADLLFVAAQAKEGIQEQTLWVLAHAIGERMRSAKAALEVLETQP